ncbi:MAG: hypothetical protein LBQ54_07140 [Planctomycetaceae bacterium]|nr:hypothetical protein [Planctomycetaceae bacterium]
MKPKAIRDATSARCPLRSNNPLPLVAGIHRRKNDSNASSWKRLFIGSEPNKVSVSKPGCSVRTLLEI